MQMPVRTSLREGDDREPASFGGRPGVLDIRNPQDGTRDLVPHDMVGQERVMS